MKKDNPKILMNVTHGFQARMLLRTDIRKKLVSAGASLVIVSENAGEHYFEEEFATESTVIVKARVKVGRIESAIVKLRQYFLMNPALGQTLNSKRETFLRTASRTKRVIVDYGNKIFGSVPGLRESYLWLESAIFRGAEFDSLLKRFSPDLVVTGTPGFNSSDAHLLRAAKRAGILTATVMLSWDNLTSKGDMAAKPDHLLVWSKLMAQEATNLHDFPLDRIYLTGAAQFDHYKDRMHAEEIAKWREMNDICSDCRLIFYGTINPSLLPHEQSIIKELAAALDSIDDGNKYFLWVRLHPQMVKGPFAVEIDSLMKLQGANVRIEVPRVQSEALPWDLPADDSEHLSSVLDAADVLVTTCSTLVIDAACVGTPIINVFYDGEGEFDSGFSVQRFRRYTHYEKILKTNGIAVVESIPQFVDQVKRYCDDPTVDSEGRKHILDQQLGGFDGAAGTATAKKLLELTSSKLQ